MTVSIRFFLVNVLQKSLTAHNVQINIFCIIVLLLCLSYSTTDLWTNLEEVYPLKKSNGYTIKEVMNSWLTTKHFPELYVIRNFGDKTAKCHAIFRNDEMKRNHWKIPITYITQSNLISNNTPNVTWYQWPNDKIITDIDPEDFILVNVEHVGEYKQLNLSASLCFISCLVLRFNYIFVNFFLKKIAT